MNEHKKIDRFFQEKLKGLEASPSPKVWTEIAANLKNKKRKVFPIWWLSSGVAAILILSVFIYPIIFNTTEKNPILKQPNLIVQPTKNLKKPLQEKTLLDPKTEIVSTEKNPINSPIILAKEPQINTKERDVVTIKIAMNTEKKPVIIKEKYQDSLLTSKEIKKDSISRDSTFTQKKKKDFLSEIKKNSLKVTENKSSNKWSLAPVFSIINSNSFSNTSSLDASLQASKTKGKSNYSYGVKIAYQLNNKWAIQSGVHFQKLDYATNNLAVVSNISGNNFRNINYASTSSNFSISSSNAEKDVLLLSGANLLTDKATLIQTYGYLEIPIETTYEFIRAKKFKAHFITGISSLFLTKNNIEITSRSFSEILGKANNLNSFNLSGNLGLDFDFALNPKLKLTVNPMLKIPLKTFSKNSNGFKPYLIGVYTGLKYQF
mgnify:CR=1 FL=1